MPLFFFDVHSHDLSRRDDEGSLCRDRVSARFHAQRLLATLAAEKARDDECQHLFVSIRDETCRTLCTCSIALGCTWIE